MLSALPTLLAPEFPIPMLSAVPTWPNESMRSLNAAMVALLPPGGIC
jgi:hypothetical protein